MNERDMLLITRLAASVTISLILVICLAGWKIDNKLSQILRAVSVQTNAAH